jgi:hypothetical protein
MQASAQRDEPNSSQGFRADNTAVGRLVLTSKSPFLFRRRQSPLHNGRPRAVSLAAENLEMIREDGVMSTVIDFYYNPLVFVSVNHSIPFPALIPNSNVSGDNITEWAFLDAGGTSSGYFALNGTVEPGGQWIYVPTDKLSSLQYVGGSAAGGQTLYVEAFDASLGLWTSPLASITAKTTVQHYQLLFSFDQSPNNNGLVQPGSLVATIYHNGIAVGNPIVWVASGDDAFPLKSTGQAGASLDSPPSQISPSLGLVFNINGLAPSSNQKNVELHVGTVPLFGQDSYNSKSCLVVSQAHFLTPLENAIRQLVNPSSPSSVTDTALSALTCSPEFPPADS